MDESFYTPWTVDHTGYRFTFSGNQGSLPISDTLFSGILSNTSSFTSVQILMQLVDEELATSNDTTILISHDKIAQLPVEELRAILLPEPLPFELEIRSHGMLVDHDFHYVYYFLNGRDQPFVNPIRIGTYLEISKEQCYLIIGDTWGDELSVMQRDGIDPVFVPGG